MTETRSKRRVLPLVFIVNSFTKTIIPLAFIASESIAQSAFGLKGYWLIANSGSRNNYELVDLTLPWSGKIGSRGLHVATSVGGK